MGPVHGLSALLVLFMPFIKDGLDLVEQAFGPDGFDIRLLKVNTHMVQALQVVLLVLLAPYFIES